MDKPVKAFTILSLLVGIVSCAIPLAVVAEEQPTKAASSPSEEKPNKKITAPSNAKPSENPAQARTAPEPPVRPLQVQGPTERANTPVPGRTSTETERSIPVRVPSEHANIPTPTLRVVAEHRERDRLYFPHRDFARFDDRERTLWLSGRWSQNCFEGLCGFWWLASGIWHFYAEPIYPYPIVVSDVVYVEQTAVTASPVVPLPPPPPTPAPIVVVAPPPQPVAPPPPSVPPPQPSQSSVADQPQNQSLQNLFK